jgi:hypothetical protein
MKHKKQTNKNPRWLVAVGAKNPRKKNEVFGFATKRGAIGFSKDISKMGGTWMFADVLQGNDVQRKTK